MKNKIENILFDLDGTLTDPKEGIINSILFALQKLNIEENNISELNTFIGPSLRESFVSRYNLTESLADKAISYYREYFSAKGLFENVVYPEIPGLLEFLKESGFNLYVATAKPEPFAEQILNHFNLDKYFNGITGSNLDNTRTDKTEVITYLVSLYAINPVNSVMIGDRKHDIIGAKNNSMRSVAVTYGYGTIDELSVQNPDYIVHSCNELKSLLINNS